MSFDFDFEWADPGDARAADLRATWARLRIVVDGQVVTHVLDTAIKTERDAVYLPLLPLAEWITANWFFLFEEVGSRHTHQQAFLSRHSIDAAGQGYSLPAMRLLPEGTQIDLRWQKSKPRFGRLTYLASGGAHLPKALVRDALEAFVQAVVDRLMDSGVAQHPLIDEWTALQQVPADEIAFANAAASMGLDPYDMDVEVERAILLACEKLPPEIFDEFLAITRFSEINEQVAWITRAIDHLSTQSGGLAALGNVKLDAAQFTPRREPHLIGTGMARALRDALDINGRPVHDLLGIARLFGSYASLEEAGILVEQQPSRQVQAIVEGAENPKFLLTTPRLDGQRFALSRAIFDHLLNPRRVDLVTDSFMLKDKASRAFAAEFLAPVDGIRRELNGVSVLDEDGVADLAETFQVSSRVIEHQVSNNNLAELVPAG